MKILSIVGARPQFIKVAPIIQKLLTTRYEHILIHTGQHYDYGMSQVFFDQMGLPEPDINLGIGSGSHATQTGKMLISIEKVLLDVEPDWVIVYGDTNSTLAGALAAAKLNIPLAHVEAGLRSYNRTMPEEHNRVLTDHCSDLLFCPTHIAVQNLAREGIDQGVYQVGDVMYDAVLQLAEIARKRSGILELHKLTPKGYALVTIHRPYNVDDSDKLRSILETLDNLGLRIIFPVHPRTSARIKEFKLDDIDSTKKNLIFSEALDYLDLLMLEQNAQFILTDSGGIQKEAYFFGVPCLTLRPETEWVETVESGWNQLVNPGHKNILQAINNIDPKLARPNLFGDGTASIQIIRILEEHGSKNKNPVQ